MKISDKQLQERYYLALVDKDASFLGSFYACVKTTSIFCLATCRARKPLAKNVEFFTTVKEAMDHGYRPCKICRPTSSLQEIPSDVKESLKLVAANPHKKIADSELKKNNLSPSKIRRWFQNNYGLSFHAYQRMFRINSAFEELKAGRKVPETAYGVGFESISGFNYTYKKLIGQTPAEIKSSRIILINRLETVLGPMFICATDKGICLLEFVDRKMLETEFRDLQRLLKARIIFGSNEHIEQAKEEVAEYFKGKRKSFTCKLEAPGSEFSHIVWAALQRIPFGRTSTYSELAEAIGRPEAHRAVASANGFNRIAIIIPCHRVVGKNGELRGYGGGLERKKWLLNHEKKYL